ncbi:MAG: hypothetical protein RL026_681 [Pseudomonadota bacterium]
MVAAAYRSYELPWDVDEAGERRFRRHVGAALLAVLLAGLVIPWIELPRPEQAPAEAVPERLVQLMQSAPPRPPPPAPPVEVEVEPVPAPQARPAPRPQPDRKVEARRSAERAINQYAEAFADLRQSIDAAPAAPTRQLSGTVNGTPRAERSLIAARAGSGSAGVATAPASRGFGAGAGSLKDHEATTVGSALANAAARPAVSRQGSSGKAARSPEEIEQVFDRHKGAIHALYSRALRERPELQGKLVLEFTIAPSGEVTACRVLSSELGDAELERKIVARVRQIRFEDKDVAVMTTTKPIEFFPA